MSATVTAESTSEVALILRLFRAAVPCARGVVIATDDGFPIAHDLPQGFDPVEAARHAVADRSRAASVSTGGTPASAFVDTPSGLALVVFLARDVTAHAGGLARDADRAAAEWVGMDLGSAAARVLAA